MLRAAFTGILIGCVAVAACGSDNGTAAAPTVAPLCQRTPELDGIPKPESYEYSWSCEGAVPAAGQTLPDTTPADDCQSGIWPDLDDTALVCPTISDVQRTDPVSGRLLPSADARSLPIDIPLSEADSFLPPNTPSSWPSTIRVVAWNLEYSARFDVDGRVVSWAFVVLSSDEGSHPVEEHGQHLAEELLVIEQQQHDQRSEWDRQARVGGGEDQPQRSAVADSLQDLRYRRVPGPKIDRPQHHDTQRGQPERGSTAESQPGQYAGPHPRVGHHVEVLEPSRSIGGPGEPRENRKLQPPRVWARACIKTPC